VREASAPATVVAARGVEAFSVRNRIAGSLWQPFESKIGICWAGLIQDRLLIWFNTRLVIGRYSLDEADGLLTVRTEHGSKTIQNGGLATKRLAKLMLRELAQEGKA